MTDNPNGCENDLFCGMNQPSTQNVEEMNSLEKKHAVIIDCPDEVKKNTYFYVEVRVGEYMEHPNKPSHFIEWIELYSGDNLLSRLHLTPAKTDYILKTRVKLDHHSELVGRVRCNLHGTWENRKDIKLVD